jgi:hypothetical protein
MRTYVFVLPVLLGCGFLTDPIDTDPPLDADEIARLSDGGRSSSQHDSGADEEPTPTEDQDSAVEEERSEIDGGAGGISGSGHLEAGEDGGHLKPDAGADAGSPAVDASVVDGAAGSAASDGGSGGGGAGTTASACDPVDCPMIAGPFGVNLERCCTSNGQCGGINAITSACEPPAD